MVQKVVSEVIDTCVFSVASKAGNQAGRQKNGAFVISKSTRAHYTKPATRRDMW